MPNDFSGFPAAAGALKREVLRIGSEGGPPGPAGPQGAIIYPQPLKPLFIARKTQLVIYASHVFYSIVLQQVSHL